MHKKQQPPPKNLDKRKPSTSTSAALREQTPSNEGTNFKAFYRSATAQSIASEQIRGIQTLACEKKHVAHQIPQNPRKISISQDRYDDNEIADKKEKKKKKKSREKCRYAQ